MYNNPLGKKLNPRSSHRENNYFHIKTLQELAGSRSLQLLTSDGRGGHREAINE